MSGFVMQKVGQPFGAAERSPVGRALDFVGAAFGAPPAARHGAGRPAKSVLRVGSAVSLNGGPLALGLRRFRTEHPDVPLVFQDGDARQQLEWLQRGAVDVVFACRSRLPTAARPVLLWREPIFVLLPEGHPLVRRAFLDDLDLDGAHVLTTRGQGFEPIGIHLQTLAGRGRLTLSRNAVERETLASLVALGEGIAFAGASFLSAYHPGVVPRPFRCDGFIAEVSAFLLPDAKPSAAALVAEVKSFSPVSETRR